ncbi:MAG: hypothetical protein ACYS9Y_04020 [Planctomycetota bacterium]
MVAIRTRLWYYDRRIEELDCRANRLYGKYQMKPKNLSLSSAFLICLTIVEDCLACGHCYTAFVWNKNPIYLGLFFVALCYGIIVFFVFGVLRLFKFKKYVLSFLIFLLLSHIFYFISTECMLGPPGFITATVFCFLVPLILYFKPILKNHVNKTPMAKKISFILLPIFVALSLAVGYYWQNKADKYFDKHLIEMLKIKSVSIGHSVMTKLISIEDKNEQEKYIAEIKQIVETGPNYSTPFALNVLVEWQGIDATPTILKGWENGTLYKNKAINALQKLSGKDFSNLKDWQNWWQKNKTDMLKSGAY